MYFFETQTHKRLKENILTMFGQQTPKTARLATASHDSHTGITKMEGNQTHEGPYPESMLWSMDWQG